MEPFKVHILGCGSALPTMRHNASSQVVEIRGKLFMVDCGEGTQVQLRRSRIGFTRIGAIFISHKHGDHCFGLLGMISTFGLLGRTAPLHIFAHAELCEYIDASMRIFCSGLEYDVVFHPINTERHQVIYEDRSLTVESLPLAHRVPCCGFLFKEKPGLPHIRRDMIDFYRIPISQINNIKNGADWVDDKGRLVPNSRLTLPADEPRSYAYCSDTKYLPRLHELIDHVTVLYHEATYRQCDEASATKYCHSTAQQAAMVARDAHAGRLVLGHYSAKIEDEGQLLSEASPIFPNTELSQEGNIIDV